MNHLALSRLVRKILACVSAAAAVAALSIVALTASATPATAAPDGGCVNFAPDGRVPDISISAGWVSVGTGNATAPMKLCVRADIRGGNVVNSYGYRLSTPFFGLHDAELCGVWIDVDFWNRRTGRLDFHSQGSLVTSFPGYGSSDRYKTRSGSFEGRRTYGTPFLMAPGTTICAMIYRHSLVGGQSPAMVARACMDF